MTVAPATYLPAPGDLITPAQLTASKAQELVAALNRPGMPFVQFVECRRIVDGGPSTRDVVVFDTDVEVGQHTAHDIRLRERIAVAFPVDDSLMPEVLALRDDFPLVPHTNIRDVERPRSLCLFDRPYEELRLNWTAMSFIERIREWLALTARGELHDEDQPLEPLLQGIPVYLILPSDLLEKANPDAPEPLYIYGLATPEEAAWRVLVGQRQPEPHDERRQLQYVATTLFGAPQTHGLIHRQPENMKELHDFLGAASIDLLAELRGRLASWAKDPALLAAKLIVILALPKTRTPGGEVESTETWAFACGKTVGEIGEEIGIWSLHKGIPGTLLTHDPSKDGSGVPVQLLSPVYMLDRRKAAQYNGLRVEAPVKLAAIGLGALGSQVFDNLMRMGFGVWSLIDRDVLLPHNTARHQMHGNAVGFSKVAVLTTHANVTIDGEDVATGLLVDVLRPGARRDELEAALAGTEGIVDMSASVPVARYLARDVQSGARRISLYLNPTGSDLVLLAEDTERQVRLDMLEMQYYREVIHNSALTDHLQNSDTSIRYGLACRDVSAIVPQDLVVVHSGIGASAIRQALATPEAQAAVWRVDPASMDVRRVGIIPYEVIEQECNGWHICTDRWLLEKVAQARLNRLPAETGGVLVGTFDTQRRIIYVVDTVPSPPDSAEWPTVYIRGYEGLASEIGRIHRETADALAYVGEWHAHPRGHGPSDSQDDRTALALLAEEMAFEGLPALMLIMADNSDYQWYIKHEP